MECKCAQNDHDLGKLAVGDVVCEYCSTLTCGDKFLPAWGVDSVKMLEIKGRPEGCNGQA